VPIAEVGRVVPGQPKPSKAPLESDQYDVAIRAIRQLATLSASQTERAKAFRLKAKVSDLALGKSKVEARSRQWLTLTG
jgi:hypothetical protein